MSMHLEQPYLTTLNTRKRKQKPTKAKLAQWREDHRIFNKENKRYKIPPITFEEYVDTMVYGKPHSKKQFSKMDTASHLQQDRIEEYKNKYPSKQEHGSDKSCTKKESPKYTGTYVKGVATMHKSNAVPVVDDQHAKDLASMRR